jgi:hypothetical protein
MSEPERMSHFLHGLKPHIRSELKLRPPSTFDDAVAMAERCDRLAWSNRPTPQLSHRPSSQSFQRPPSQSFQRAPVSARGPSPMELGAMMNSAMHNRRPSQPQTPRGPLSAAEKEYRFTHGLCLYCGKPGHITSSCPAKRQPPNGRRPAGPRQ